jgi:hypothetical protein
MTREERSQELQRLIYRQAAGLPERATIPLGFPITKMKEVILDREFPPDHSGQESG